MMDINECRLLLVDDEPQLLELVTQTLVSAGFSNIETASCAGDADRLLRGGDYQLVLLDVMLPDTDGFSLYASWREAGIDLPVIFLSARDEDKARLRGLGLGADDYITKPFLPEELTLRIRSVLRRTYRCIEEKAYIGNAAVDFSSGTLTRGGREYELTAKEFALLQKLCERRGKIVSIDSLTDALWPDGSFGYENSLMVHIRRVREKLEDDPSNPEHLITVRGLGYKLK